jgi:hypothetical protein
MALLLPEGRRSRRPLLHVVAAPASLHYAAAALAVNLQKRHSGMGLTKYLFYAIVVVRMRDCGSACGV